MGVGSSGRLVVVRAAHGRKVCSRTIPIDATRATAPGLRKFAGQKFTIAVYGNGNFGPAVCRGLRTAVLLAGGNGPGPERHRPGRADLPARKGSEARRGAVTWHFGMDRAWQEMGVFQEMLLQAVREPFERAVTRSLRTPSRFERLTEIVGLAHERHSTPEIG